MQRRFDFEDDTDTDDDGPPPGYDEFLKHLEYALKFHPALAFALRRMNEANAASQADAGVSADFDNGDDDSPESQEEKKMASGTLRYQRMKLAQHHEMVLKHLHENPQLAIEHGEKAVFAAGEALGIFRHDE